MGRKGAVQTWSLTYSPKEDVEHLPSWLENYLASNSVTHAFAVTEKASKWHIHVAFRTLRTYGSDYKKWWLSIFKEFEIGEPELCVKHHSDITILAGGYCHKSTDNYKILFNKGFTQSMLDNGAKLYKGFLTRQTTQDYIATQRVINPGHMDAAIASYMVQYDVERGEAILLLAKTGFTFANANLHKDIQGTLTDVYKDTFKDFIERRL